MGIELDKRSAPRQLVGKPEYNTDTAALVNLDMIHQFNQNIPCQRFDILILLEGPRI